MLILPETWDDLLRPLVGGLIAYGTIVLLTRVSGQRVFSKIWSFDMAVTVSIGSLLASITLTKSVSLVAGVIALLVVFSLQLVMAKARETKLLRATANPPILLMDGPHFIAENLKSAKVTRKDVIAALRQSGVTQFDQVQAVVLESNGEMSVLTGNAPPHPDIMEGISQKSKK